MKIFGYIGLIAMILIGIGFHFYIVTGNKKWKTTYILSIIYVVLIFLALLYDSASAYDVLSKIVFCVGLPLSLGYLRAYSKGKAVIRAEKLAKKQAEE